MPQSRVKSSGYIDADVQTEELLDGDEFYVTRPAASIQRRIAGRSSLVDQAKTVIAEPLLRRTGQPQASRPGLSTKPVAAKKSQPHWLIFIGIGMLICLAFYIALTGFGSWWTNHQNDATYGNPRTYQIDAVVGHNDSAAHPSHFIFLNLNSHIIVIELPGGDPAKTITYTGPTLIGDKSNLIPVTGSFVKDPQTGREDLDIQYQGQQILFTNNGSKFIPPQN